MPRGCTGGGGRGEAVGHHRCLHDLLERLVPHVGRRARLLDHRNLLLAREVALDLAGQELAHLHGDLDRVELAAHLRGDAGAEKLRGGRGATGEVSPELVGELAP